MHRIACFRDDLVFFIYLYQRWIYRVDHQRRNEYGVTGYGKYGKSRSLQSALCSDMQIMVVFSSDELQTKRSTDEQPPPMLAASPAAEAPEIDADSNTAATPARKGLRQRLVADTS